MCYFLNTKICINYQQDVGPNRRDSGSLIKHVILNLIYRFIRMGKKNGWKRSPFKHLTTPQEISFFLTDDGILWETKNMHKLIHACINIHPYIICRIHMLFNYLWYLSLCSLSLQVNTKILLQNFDILGF